VLFNFACEPQCDWELTEANWPRGPSLSDLLFTFVNLFGEFGINYWGFGTAPDTSFKPKWQGLTSAMNALVSIGYAETADDGFVWTDKMGPVMVTANFWPETL